LIETASLVLRPFTLEDASPAYHLSHEAAYREGLPSQVYADEAEARGVLARLIQYLDAPSDPRSEPYVLAVDHRQDRRLIGHVGLSPFEGEVEVGFAIAHAYQRRGFATEAVATTCRWALGRFGLSRILALAAPANQGSRIVLGRAGFEHTEDRLLGFQGREQRVSVYHYPGRRAR
jgi:RimJ/RimL family protein N-acetyltransferase